LGTGDIVTHAAKRHVPSLFPKLVRNTSKLLEGAKTTSGGKRDIESVVGRRSRTNQGRVHCWMALVTVG